MAEMIDKWEVVNKLIQLENNYQFYKEKWDADVLYRRICELEIGIGKTPGIEVSQDDHHWATEQAYKNGYADGQPKWISVKDRLPEKMGKYVCIYVFGEEEGYPFEQVLWYYPQLEKPHFQHEGSMGLRVTHWMPLPEAPKGE